MLLLSTHEINVRLLYLIVDMDSIQRTKYKCKTIWERFSASDLWFECILCTYQFIRYYMICWSFSCMQACFYYADRNLYTIRAVPFADVRSIKRHTPALGWQYIIVVLSFGKETSDCTAFTMFGCLQANFHPPVGDKNKKISIKNENYFIYLRPKLVEICFTRIS